MSRNAELDRLAPLFTPTEATARLQAASILVNSLMEGQDDQRFLWREESPGNYVIFSTKKPNVSSNIIIYKTILFQPNIYNGARVRFRLCANPTMVRSKAENEMPRRYDVIMHELYTVPSAQRAARRLEIIQSCGLAWLQKQGKQHGFEVIVRGLQIGRYRQISGPKTKGATSNISLLEYAGELMIVDPDIFISTLIVGIGSKKRLGCGLLLFEVI